MRRSVVCSLEHDGHRKACPRVRIQLTCRHILAYLHPAPFLTEVIMRRTILLLAAGILNLPAPCLSAQIPALSVMPDLPRSMLDRLKPRPATLIAHAHSPKFHTEIDKTPASVFAADCGGLFRTNTVVFPRK